MTKSGKGFTLIELIVALGITAAMGFFAVSIAIGVADVWSVAEERSAESAEAQFALDTIAQDLESAFFSEQGLTMFAVTALEDGSNSGRWVDASSLARPSTPDPFNPTDDQYGWAGSWIRFFTAAPGLNAVGYQLIRSPVVGSSSTIRYNLYRGVVRMDHTLNTGYGITLNDYSTAGTPTLGNPVEVVSPRVENIILSNVIDFGIRLYIYDESAEEPGDAPPGLRIIFPADGVNQLDAADDEHLANTGLGLAYGSRFPEAAEVIIRVLGESGWEQLELLEEQGGTAAEWQRIVDENSTVYRRFVDMRARPFAG